MSWFVDNATSLYILLGVIAAGFVLAWKFNQRVKFLAYAAGVLVLIGLVWLLTQFVVSDSKQLEMNVHAMADAVVAGKTDDLFKHISKDFRYKVMTREMLYEVARRSMEAHHVRDVRITKFQVEDVSRAKKLAKTSFRFTVRGAEEGQMGMWEAQADFVLESDQWKLITMRFYNISDKDTEISLPGL